MKLQAWIFDVLTAALALVPAAVFWRLGSAVPAQIPTHFTAGQPDGFTSRPAFDDVMWLPVVVFLALTLVPQIRTAGLFWRSARQRQLRAVLVGFVSVCLLAALLKAAAPFG